MAHLYRPRHQRGFTLIEIMVVLVIIGVLAALIAPNVLDRASDAKVTAARTDVNNLMQALKLYKLDNQRFPSTEQGLQALVRNPLADPYLLGLSGGASLGAVLAIQAGVDGAWAVPAAAFAGALLAVSAVYRLARVAGGVLDSRVLLLGGVVVGDDCEIGANSPDGVSSPTAARTRAPARGGVK